MQFFHFYIIFKFVYLFVLYMNRNLLESFLPAKKEIAGYVLDITYTLLRTLWNDHITPRTKSRLQRPKAFRGLNDSNQEQ